MNMNTKNNARRQDTLHKIKDAYLNLLQTKAVKEVAVTDVCTQADVDRSTFYACFEDLNALQKYIVNEADKELESMGRKALEKSESGLDFTWLFDYAKEHHTFFKAYLEIGDSTYMIDTTSDHYRLLFFKRGLRAVMKQWFTDGCVESPTEMNSLVLRNFKPEFFCENNVG